MSTPTFAPPKVSSHRLSLTINENLAAITSGAPKGGSSNKIKKCGNESLLAPVQDCALGAQSSAKKANTSLLIGLTEEAGDSRDNQLKPLSAKLKQAKGAWHFAAGSDDAEWARTKKRKASDLEDEVGESLGSEQLGSNLIF